MEMLQKKGGELEDPSPLLAHGRSVPRAMAPQKEEQKFRSSTKTACHLHFSLLLWLVARSECSLAFPKQGSILRYLPELKITAPTYHRCCFCLAVVLLHRLQQSPISVKLQ